MCCSTLFVCDRLHSLQANSTTGKVVTKRDCVVAPTLLLEICLDASVDNAASVNHAECRFAHSAALVVTRWGVMALNPTCAHWHFRNIDLNSKV